VPKKEKYAITLGATLETAVLFLSLALAVYGWLGVPGAESDKGANQNERLVYHFIAGSFTVLAAGAWLTLAFVVRPFG
jgi:hypothetical protein